MDLRWGERLWIERIRLELDLEEFGKLIGETDDEVFGWEDGTKTPRMEKREVWMGAGLDIGWIDWGIPSFEQDKIVQELLVPLMEMRIENAISVLDDDVAVFILKKFGRQLGLIAPASWFPNNRDREVESNTTQLPKGLF